MADKLDAILFGDALDELLFDEGKKDSSKKTKQQREPVEPLPFITEASYLSQGAPESAESLGRNLRATGSQIASSFYGGWSNLAKGLSDIERYLFEKTKPSDKVQPQVPLFPTEASMLAQDIGIEPELFKRIDEIMTEKADYWDKRAKEIGINVVNEIVGEAIGGMVPGVTEFSLNIPYYALKGAAEAEKSGESELVGALKGIAYRYVMGKIFKLMHPLNRPLRSLGMGTVFGTETALRGGDVEEISKAAAIGGLYGLVGGKRPPEQKYKSEISQFVKEVKEKLDKERARIIPKEELTYKTGEKVGLRVEESHPIRRYTRDATELKKAENELLKAEQLSLSDAMEQRTLEFPTKPTWLDELKNLEARSKEIEDILIERAKKYEGRDISTGRFTKVPKEQLELNLVEPKRPKQLELGLIKLRPKRIGDEPTLEVKTKKLKPEDIKKYLKEYSPASIPKLKFGRKKFISKAERIKPADFELVGAKVPSDYVIDDMMDSFKKMAPSMEDNLRETIIRHIEKNDLRPILDFEIINTPRGIGVKFPNFMVLVDLYDRKVYQSNKMQDYYYNATLPYWELPKKERKALKDVFFEGDRKKKVFTRNELLAKGLNDRQIEAYYSVRKALDEILDKMVQVLEATGASKDNIQLFIKERTGYFPAMRYGDWGVVVFRKNLPYDHPDRVVRFEMFETDKWGKSKWKARRRARELEKEIKAQGLERELGIETKPYPKLPDEYINDLPSSRKINQLLERIKKSTSNDVVKEAIDEFRSNEVVRRLLARGFTKHFIRRKDIPGRSEDIDRVLRDYFVNYSDWFTKLDVVEDMWAALGRIDPSKQPRLYSYASKYLHYVLHSRTPEFNKLREFMFYWYLGANVKSAFNNATQNFLTAAPLLSEYSKGSGYLKISKAMKDIATGKNIKELERKALKEAEDAGVIKEIYTSELSGMIRSQFDKHLTSKLKAAARFMFAEVERFNRATTYLAAYRTAMEKLVKDKKMTEAQKHESAMAFAKWVVDETHWQYGKGNRPIIGRGMLAPIMTFRLFPINYVIFLRNRYRDKQYKALLKSIGFLMAMGGLGGMLGYKTLNAAYGWLSGGDDLSLLTARGIDKALGYFGFSDDVKKKAHIAVTKGLPAALVGVDLSGSIGMGDIPPGGDANTIADILEDLLGVVGGTVRRGYQAYEAYQSGNLYRAIENLSPEAIRNIMVAIRLYKEGPMSVGGRRLGEPISTIDFAKKLLAFQPTSLSEIYEAERISARKRQMIEKKVRKYYDRLSNAFKELYQTGNPARLNAIVEEINNDEDMRAIGWVPDLNVPIERFIGLDERSTRARMIDDEIYDQLMMERKPIVIPPPRR